MKDQEIFALFEMTPDLVCIVNKEGWFKKINPAVSKTLGFTEEELYSNPVASFIHPDDKDMTRLMRSKLLQNQPLLNFQNRYLTRSGSFVWLEWTSIYLPDKETVFAIAKDITSRKETEIEIEENYKKYKSLTTHFKNNVEKDRKYFAVELHEELAQLATVIKMDIDWLQSNSANTSELFQDRIRHANATSTILIDKIRKVSYSVSASNINDLGLNEVLKSLCDEFSSLTGITCDYESTIEEAELSGEIKLDFLRICQEALSNVMHHSNASHVKIKMEIVDNKIHLSVIDNGRGFEVVDNKESFGLTNMQGRAASINGKLSIESKISNGTKVSVVIEKDIS